MDGDNDKAPKVMFVQFYNIFIVRKVISYDIIPPFSLTGDLLEFWFGDKKDVFSVCQTKNCSLSCTVTKAFLFHATGNVYNLSITQ